MPSPLPARIGVLIDYLKDEGYDANVLKTLQLVADDYHAKGLIERPVEFVVRATQGLPLGSFRAVKEAFDELVAEDVLVVFGPWVSENAVALRDHVEELAEVACITMAASENALGDFLFALPAGSLEEEPIIISAVAAFDGVESVGIAFEGSLIGQEYLRSARAALVAAGLRITDEVMIPQVHADKLVAMSRLAEREPDAIVHVGFGLGIVGMNKALTEIGWMPPRYTTTAFEFSATDKWWRGQLAGWTGLDQYDERNPIATGFLDRFEERYGDRPEYFFPLYCYDVGRMMVSAIADARPMTGRGVKEALERVKMLPAASGAPGTRMRFGKYIRHGWVGSEFLVARRVLEDGSRTVLHGTINGLVESG